MIFAVGIKNLGRNAVDSWYAYILMDENRNVQNIKVVSSLQVSICQYGVSPGQYVYQLLLRNSWLGELSILGWSIAGKNKSYNKEVLCREARRETRGLISMLHSFPPLYWV